MTFVKLHKISTFLAVVSVIICCTLLFLSMLDRAMGLNILPQFLETFVMLAAWVFGSIAIGSCIVSIVLSFYIMATKD